MGTKSKFFRAFVAGTTISDGREITPEMIDQIVETFDIATYTPRINIEHISGYSPEPPFNGYGSVIAVKAQDDDITIDGKTEKRKALYAQVDANDQLVELAAKDQKPFPSVELTGSYAGTGKVGLIGLAFTDRPASIATQSLKFSNNAPGTVFASSDVAGALEFEIVPADKTLAESIKAAFASVAATFKPEQPKSEPQPQPQPEPQPKAANDNDMAAFAVAIGDQVATAVAAAVKPANDAVAAIRAEFATLQTRLETAEAPGFSRKPATGGQGGIVTDC